MTADYVNTENGYHWSELFVRNSYNLVDMISEKLMPDRQQVKK